MCMCCCRSGCVSIGKRFTTHHSRSQGGRTLQLLLGKIAKAVCLLHRPSSLTVRASQPGARGSFFTICLMKRFDAINVNLTC